MYILLLGGIITTILLVIPYPKTNSRDCEALIYKNIEKGDLQKAKAFVLNYKRDKSLIYGGVSALITAFVEHGDLAQAKATFQHYLKPDWGRAGHTRLVDALIEKGQYDEAYNYMNWTEHYFYKDCIIHMCKNKQFEEARKYLKRVSIEAFDDKKERAEWVQNMNQTINSYQY